MLMMVINGCSWENTLAHERFSIAGHAYPTGMFRPSLNIYVVLKNNKKTVDLEKYISEEISLFISFY